MKTPTLILIAFAAVSQAQQPAFRDAATHDSLAGKFRHAQAADPMKAMPPAEGEDPTVVNRVGNLLENSEILSYNGLTTLVPKNAIVLAPPKFAGRVNAAAAGTALVGWLDFYAVNRGWISTVEVTFAQARGDEPVSPETLQALGKSGNMIVAVLKGGPISVMPPKAEKSDSPVQTAQAQQP